MNDTAPSLKLHQLLKLVQEAIDLDPFECDGFQWAALPQKYYCQQLGISPATLRRRISRPPFVRERARKDGKVVALLRVGKKGPITHRHTANIMAKIWQEKTGRRASPEEYGCLVGLAESWPPDQQLKLFRMVLDQWSVFMAGVDSEITLHKAKNDNKLYKRFYRFPSLRVIRRFSNVATEMELMNVQEAGDAPHPAIVALYPNLSPIQKNLLGAK